ncbi:MFS transporter [Eoetvoesiella caeni]|uniref:Putative MFS family arabinose efflux permease n=1 Tax=Eoetvoesiella caeni TaxID=645616 RepID=A0A366HCH2_9BURK|nr:MFS transporter [Eoetvoesiella caeni]MCI2809195.1 MFS transporter [Eoetvoesiella caeni]NYT54337.1 MFS transporter [Eoetvoesiella caeni]RBP39477.1 putative MFS family arabinose efflux permease [Eoetvoesiella caeni]
MLNTVASFSSLYFATLLLLLSTGLFNTYMGLRLSAANVSELWIGALIAVYYLGLVLGARNAHKLILQVGHIRAYVASAAIVTTMVLAQALTANLWLWLLFRFVVGVSMVAQFMVIESWLNEQTENAARGRVFAFYMVFSGLGTVLGQLSLTLFPRLNHEPLIFAAICSVLCLVPVALTRRLHPAVPVPAPIMVRYYLARVPMSLLVVFITGNLTGAFYGLAPVFAVKQGLSSDQVAWFLAAAVAAGLLAQWPLGMLSDRVNRSGLIRFNAVLLALVGIPLWGWWVLPFWALIVVSCAFGALQFPLYPIGTAFANDNVEPDRRVGLSAIVIMAYGLGAGLGPFIAGALMRFIDTDMFFIFVSGSAVILVLFIRPQQVTGEYLSEDAPTHFVPMSELQASPVVAVLDPRTDPQTDVSGEPVPQEG